MCLMARSTKPTQSSSTRVETDSFGPIEAAADRHRGAQTDRSRQNFRIGRDRINRTIARAASEATGGKLDEQFPPALWQTGPRADTNLNDVIANRVNGLPGDELGSKIPVAQNNHVDIGPSSNNSFPTAIQVAAAPNIVHDVVPLLSELHRALRGKEKAFAKIVKIDRAHTRHATPLTVGQELSDRAAQLGCGAKWLELAVTELVLPENQPTCTILSTLTYCMMHSIQLLADAVCSFAEHFVSDTLRELKQRSLMMVTTLAPNIGCDNAAKMTQSEHARAELC